MYGDVRRYPNYLAGCTVPRMGNTRDSNTREDWQAHTHPWAHLTGRRKMREKEREREGRVLTREQATVEATLTCNIRNNPRNTGVTFFLTRWR